jgi:hypothetical protein
VICFVFKPCRIVDGQRQERKCYSGKLKLDSWAKPWFPIPTTDSAATYNPLRLSSQVVQERESGHLHAQRHAPSPPDPDQLDLF